MLKGFIPNHECPNPRSRPKGAKGLSPPPKSLIWWLAWQCGSEAHTALQHSCPLPSDLKEGAGSREQGEKTFSCLAVKLVSLELPSAFFTC